MALNPQDIVRKEFREALRGYNQADVDLFLDEVVEEFTRLAEDNQKMKIRIAALQQEVACLRESRGPATTPGPAAS
ncbi:MAG: DivIVA domain-containing protein, partial [Actinobacteria bacterium]